jgi:hypothetical protein
MRLRRLVAPMAAAAITVGMGLSPAAPASAAALTPDCAEAGGQVVITVTQGETVTVASSSGTKCTWSGTDVPDYADWFSSYTGDYQGDVGEEPFEWVISPSAPLGPASPDEAQFCVGSGALMQNPRTCYRLNVTAPASTALSTGCQSVNANPGMMGTSPLTFNAGEAVSVQFTNPMPGTTTGYILVGYTISASSPIPGTASYTFPSTGSYGLSVAFNYGYSNWVWSCSVPSEPPPVFSFGYTTPVDGDTPSQACANSDDIVIIQFKVNDVVVEEFPLSGPGEMSHGGCVSTLTQRQLTTAAYVATCKALEPYFALENVSGKPYPYSFYGMEEFTAKNRVGCVALLSGLQLLSFHAR